ncbi:MAG: hypothetical protein ABH878_02245 [bacterium]
MECREFDELYWLRAYGEALPGGEEGFLRHLTDCPRCQARAVELDQFRAILSVRTAADPQPEALSRARILLRARLQAEKSKPGWVDFWEGIKRKLRWGWNPSWQLAAAVAVLMVGFFIGKAFQFPAEQGLLGFPQTASYTTAALDEHCLEKILAEQAQITNLRIKPIAEEDGTVEVRFKAIQDYAIRGRADDAPIRDLLSWAVIHEGNSGVRLQSVEQLARSGYVSGEAKQVLAYALVNDENDGVRLKALEALGKTPRDRIVEQSFMNALLKDPNPAVRIRAIDLLLAGGAMEKPEAFLLVAAEANSNEYVRMRARRAIQESASGYAFLEQSK